MRRFCLILMLLSGCSAQSASAGRAAAEYYLAAYARHYGVPLDFARAIVEQESDWRSCAVSNKGAAGLMQLMPRTAARLGVRNRCNVQENISGGIRYLAWLMNKFHGELRLVAAAYYAGEGIVEVRGLAYANHDVVEYVDGIRQRVEREKRFRSARPTRGPGRAQ